MPRRKSFNSALEKFGTRVFQATGMSLSGLIKIGAVFIVVIVGIAITVQYKNVDLAGDASGVAGVQPKQQTTEEQFLEVSELPAEFNEMRSVEKISILNSRIEVGEELAKSGGQYAEQSSDQLVTLYGSLCHLQDVDGINSEKTYQRLAELRQQALAAGNEERAAAADLFCAYSATIKLNRCTEQADFRFAVDLVSNLDSKNLVNTKQLKQFHDDAIKLHDTSSEQDSTASFLSTLGDKLADSPVKEISNLGLNLKDYPQYGRFYATMDKQALPTRELKLQFYRELFEAIEKAPPQSPKTYIMTIRFFDNLLNPSDAKFAGDLTKQLGRAASIVNPKYNVRMDQAIKSIENRVAALSRTADLSGADADGAPLALPNGKPTVLVFWDARSQNSTQHMKWLAQSHQFDTWATNVLVASTVELSGEDYKQISRDSPQFTTLDYATSRRMMQDLGVDYVPYHVTIDKDGKVIRLGAPAR